MPGTKGGHWVDVDAKRGVETVVKFFLIVFLDK